MDEDTAPTTPDCHDDPAIGDDECLWRRVTAVEDKEGGVTRRRPGSGSLRDDRMSVDRALLSKLEYTLCLRPDLEVAQFSARSVRDTGLKIYSDPRYVCLRCRRDIGYDRAPCPTCGSTERVHHNKAHAIVCPKMSGGVARHFAKEKARLLEVSPEVRARARNLGA